MTHKDGKTEIQHTVRFSPFYEQKLADLQKVWDLNIADILRKSLYLAWVAVTETEEPQEQ